MLEIALTADRYFVWAVYGELTVCFIAQCWNDNDRAEVYTVTRHTDNMEARLVFDWATKTV